MSIGRLGELTVTKLLAHRDGYTPEEGEQWMLLGCPTCSQPLRILMHTAAGAAYFHIGCKRRNAFATYEAIGT